LWEDILKTERDDTNEADYCFFLPCTHAKKHYFLNIDKIRSVPLKKIESENSFFDLFSAVKEFFESKKEEDALSKISNFRASNRKNEIMDSKILKTSRLNASNYTNERKWYEIKLLSKNYYNGQQNWYELEFLANLKFDPIDYVLKYLSFCLNDLIIIPDCQKNYDVEKYWYEINFHECN